MFNVIYNMNIEALVQITYLTTLIFSNNSQKLPDFIYILEWTPDNLEPFNYIEKDVEAFIKRDCVYQNCILTSNRSYLSNVSDFDALLFNACHLTHGGRFPSYRTSDQQYVLVGVESAVKCPLPPVCNGVFNVTMTYRLDSDIPYPYITIKDDRGIIIGPKISIQWMDDMTSDVDIQKTLEKKSIAAAWIVSNCDPKNNRSEFVSALNNELSKYGHRVDIYGKCGSLYCETLPGDRNGNISRCSSRIKSDYYFYLAFENSNAEDYVTEKVLHGLRNFAVPVVYGGANYTRFMPKGIYIDALELGARELAKQMNDIIIDKERYYDFFRWHGYYSFHDNADDLYHDAVCGLCALLNDQTRQRVYTDITNWWNVLGAQHLADVNLYLIPPDDSESSKYQSVLREFELE